MVYKVLISLKYIFSQALVYAFSDEIATVAVWLMLNYL